MPKQRNFAVVAVVGGVVATALSGCDAPPGAAKQTEPARAVVVQAVKLQPEPAERSFVAVIRPKVEADLGFRVAGRVVRRAVDVGARVTAGQVLALLDDTDLRLQAEQAEAEVRAAESNLRTAEAQERRSTDLNARGWAASASYDQQRTVADEARGRLARATRALTLAQNALSYAALTADADGVITAALVEAGQVVAAGQPALRLAHTDVVEAQVAIPEVSIDAARTGVARVSLWARPQVDRAASLRELSPAADPATRTFQARYAIENAGRDFQIGMTATLKLMPAAAQPVAMLPLSALFNSGSGPMVWVVEPGTKAVTARPVTVQRYDAQSVVIGEGLSAGDMVVSVGVHKLEQGERVRPISAAGL